MAQHTPNAASAPAPAMKPEWSVGDGYFYKHTVAKRGDLDEDVWVSPTVLPFCFTSEFYLCLSEKICPFVVKLLASITQERLDALDKYFRPRATDIILCTFPKSGTTWVQAIITRLLQSQEQSNAPHASTDAVAVVGSTTDKSVETETSSACKKIALEKPTPSATEAPAADMGVFLGLSPADRVFWLEPLSGVVGFVPLLRHLAAVKYRRAFKTHCPLPILRKRIVPGVRVICVTRNPKDTCVSMWHHTRSKNFGYTGPFEHFAREVSVFG